jgi:pyruvate dehydrogenase E1 component beta subunit
MYANFPGLKVVMPSTAADAKGLLKSSIRDNNPVLFLEQERMYGLKGEVPEDEDFTIPLGVADIKREGSDCTIVARSMTVPLALQAAEKIQQEFDVSVEVIDPRTIKPLDIDTIVNSVKKTNRLVVAEESHYFASVGAEISHSVMEHAFDYLDAPVKRIATAEAPMPYAKNLEQLALPDVEKIIAAVKEVCYL